MFAYLCKTSLQVSQVLAWKNKIFQTFDLHFQSTFEAILHLHIFIDNLFA